MGLRSREWDELARLPLRERDALQRGCTSRAQHGVRLLAQVNGRSAKRDRLEDRTLGENTGGTVVYLSPGARWQTGLGLDIEGAVQIPVVENLFGEQDEHTTGRIAVSLSR